MKKTIIALMLLLLLLPVLYSKPIKVCFNDVSSKEDFQGHRLCSQLELLLSDPDEFDVEYDIFLDGVFVIEVVTRDPTGEGTSTCVSFDVYYHRKGYPDMKVGDALLVYQSSEIDQRAEAMIEFTKTYVDNFIKYYSGFMK
jgi:hypothetical protein